ncbi:MAG: hypothetical protein BGO43_00305 [Gammaproteobacteria bacterium 39-13]|nr:hypothetical protein [Gammaproteobacteria bacterium]OJV96704.1 MAG: hypothetical protein BGO43_00305 [Gammaproteobacteria bacterium 39-13]
MLDGVNDNNPLHIKELLKLILLQLPYAEKVRLRQVRKSWKEILEQISPVPLLNTASVKNAAEYMRINDSHPEHTGIEKLVTNYATLHPSEDSLDSLIIKFKCKWVNETDLGWQDDEPPTQDLISANTILSFATKLGKLDIEYDSLEHRDQRHLFITTYLALPHTTTHPRWQFLNKQSVASLTRLCQSLKRYTDDHYKALIPEIEDVMKARL